MLQQPLPTSGSLRVLHVIGSISVVRGGTSAAMVTLLQALRLQGVTADLITTNDDGDKRRVAVMFGRFVDHSGIRVRYFPQQLGFYNVSMPLIIWLWNHAKDYDVIHIHGLFSFVPNMAALIARLRKVPYILCPHGMLDRWGRLNHRQTLKHWSIRLIEGPNLAHAARIHFMSESEQRQACDIGLLPNGAIVALGFSESAFNALTPIPGAMEREPSTLLIVSRIHAIKGIDLLFDAYASVVEEFPNSRLIVAGDGPPELIASLKAQASRLGIQHRITWAGFVQGDAKRDLFACATAFVLASRSENFGVAVVEAMAAGLPVIVSDAVGVSDLVQRAGAGVVTELSVASLSDGIRVVLRNTADRETMGAAGRRLVKSQLSLDAFGVRLVGMYKAVVKNTTATEAHEIRLAE